MEISRPHSKQLGVLAIGSGFSLGDGLHSKHLKTPLLIGLSQVLHLLDIRLLGNNLLLAFAAHDFPQ
jgi:hypothetical protein